MTRGWRGEPQRHALAARGVPTRGFIAGHPGVTDWEDTLEDEEARLLAKLRHLPGVEETRVHGFGAYELYFTDGSRVSLSVDIDLGRIAIQSIGASPTGTGKGVLVVEAFKDYADEHVLGLCAEQVGNEKFWTKMGFTQDKEYEDVWCYE